MNKKKTIVKSVLALAAIVTVAAAGLNNDLAVRQYTVKSGKVERNVRIVQISDLHCCRYGENQSELVANIDSLNPDIVVFTGDIYDNVAETEISDELVAAVSKKYRCFYVTGNHECRNGMADSFCDRVSGFGVTVLRGDTATVTANGQQIAISGIDDKNGLTKEQLNVQREKIIVATDEKMFNVLLGHRPDFYEYFKDKFTFDLIFCGHIHGGQWRVPGIINGLVSPDFKLFPKYAGGLYTLGDTAMVVSRGLENQRRLNIPRIFNRPELVCVDVTAV